MIRFLKDTMCSTSSNVYEEILKPNKIYTNRIIQFVSCNTTFRGGLQQSGNPFSCILVVPLAMLIQNTSDSYLKLLHSCQQPPEYLQTKTCQQISLNFAMFGRSADNHKQLLFFVTPDFCGGCHLCPFQLPTS